MSSQIPSETVASPIQILSYKSWYDTLRKQRFSEDGVFVEVVMSAHYIESKLFVPNLSIGSFSPLTKTGAEMLLRYLKGMTIPPFADIVHELREFGNKTLRPDNDLAQKVRQSLLQSMDEGLYILEEIAR